MNQSMIMDHVGIWFGLGIAVSILGMSVNVQYIEGVELTLDKITLAIVGMLFGIMISRFSSIDLELRKMKVIKA